MAEEHKAATTGRAGEASGDPVDWTLRIPNRLELLCAVRALVGSTCELHGVEGDAREELLLAVSELVNNAIEHVRGPGPDGVHEVELRFGIGEVIAVGAVRDRGEGAVGQGTFDSAVVPGLDDDRGRGLFLIKAYVDDIRVTAIPGTGTEIRFVKRLGGDGRGA